MIQIWRRANTEMMVQKDVTPCDAHESSINPWQRGVHLLITPRKESVVQMKLGLLHVLEEATKLPHQSAIQPGVAFVRRLVEQIKIVTQ
jgi:hypothetical protein